MQQTVDDVVVMTRGRLVAHGDLASLEAAQGDVLVRSPERDRLATALSGELPQGRAPRPEATDTLLVPGATTERGRSAGPPARHRAARADRRVPSTSNDSSST